MGHVRLGTLPKTRKWSQIVALIRAGADAAQIAQGVISATARGLRAAASDVGVVESIWMLANLPWAARTEDFAEALRRLGLDVRDDPSLVDIVSAATATIDASIDRRSTRTDLGEMALLALAETLTDQIGTEIPGLFDLTPQEVANAFRSFATRDRFGVLARSFFGRFLKRCMEYFLSRTLSDHVGEGERFDSVADQREFLQNLETYCRESSRIVEKFAGEWTSKEMWKGDGKTTREQVRRFVGYAMKKLVDEISHAA